MARAFSSDVQGVRDYYKVLDVSHTATQDEIRRAYRSLALQYHPDRNGGSREAEERFKELAEAFHTLSDPERRDLYDVWGPGAPARSTRLEDETANLDDALAVFVRQFTAFVKEELPELSDSVDKGASVPLIPLRVRVTLAEVATGVTKEVRFPCARCSGTGVQDGGAFEGWACTACGGDGLDASGEKILVEVPAGAHGGDRVRAAWSRGGDVLAFVEVEEDPRFVRAGADVVVELGISARRGWGSEVEVPTPTGSTRVKIPWGTPVGGALRVPGEGLPARTRPGNGDLIIKLVPEGTQGALTVAPPVRAPSRARPIATKAALTVLAFSLGGVTVALLGQIGTGVATAADTNQRTSATTQVPRSDAAGEEPGGLGALSEASGTAPPEGTAGLRPASAPELATFRIPSAPEQLQLTLPGASSVAPTYSDQPIASLSPVRPERPTNVPGLAALTQAPRVRNAERVQQALQREYPVGLREARIGGRVEMSFDLDAQGRVQRFDIREGSGNSQLDAAATRVARVFEFTPALRGTEPVGTTVALGITFGEGAGVQTVASLPAARAGGPNQPVPSDFDVAPQVSNTDRVRQSLLREYPIGLRDTGIGGHVEMWFYVNEQGAAESFQIRQGSGHTALDEAALRVARVFQFTPARRGNLPIATWISLRITFEGATPGEGPRPELENGE